MQDSAEVARGLEEIAALLGFAGEPKFKVKAYQHAARLVDTLGDELGVVIEQDRLRGLQGIGVVLARECTVTRRTRTEKIACSRWRAPPTTSG
jgi:DNA polymerase/3'-5' exonuclease PolX